MYVTKAEKDVYEDQIDEVTVAEEHHKSSVIVHIHWELLVQIMTSFVS